MLVLSVSFVFLVAGAMLTLGFLAGVAFAVARRAWKDYKITKNSVPGLRKSAWATTRTAVGWIAAVAAVGVVIFAGMVSTDPDAETPAAVPSVAPTN